MFSADSTSPRTPRNAFARSGVPALLLAMILISLPAAGADDWVMAFHDSRHTGQTSEVVTPPLTLAWTWVDTDSYDNSTQFNPTMRYWLPIYYGGKICFQGGRNANRVFCLNPSNGAKIWQQDNPGYTQAGTYLFQFDNYPAAVNGRIVNASTDLTASMDAATGGDCHYTYNTNGGWPAGGVASWNNMAYLQFLRSDDSTEGYYLAQDPVNWTLTGGYYSPDLVNTITDDTMRVPAVDAGVSYLNLMGMLVAAEARTGAVVWTWGKKNVGSSPAVSNGIVYFFAGSTASLVALDTRHVTYDSTTGAQIPTLWSVPISGARSPIVSDGTVYVGSADGYFYALDAATGATKWRTWAGLWSFTAYQMPAISGDLIYVPSNNGILYVFDKRTGAEKWRYTASYPLGPVVVANGMVFVSDRRFTFYAFRPQTAAIGPAVTALSTTRAANDKPVSLTLTGSGFFAGGAAGQVQSIRLDNAGATQLTGYTVASDQSITGVVIPAGIAPGTYRLRVQTSVGQSVNEPSIEIVPGNSVFVSTLGQTMGPVAPGTAMPWQRHLARTSVGDLIAVYPRLSEDGGPQDPTYSISRDGGLTWRGQYQLHATPWNNYVSKWAPTSSIWVDAQDRLNVSYVRWSSAGQSFEKFALNSTDLLVADPAFPVFPTTASSNTTGTLVGQSSGRLWEVFEIGGQVTPFYSDNGGLAWTQLPAINQASGGWPSLVLYQGQPAIFYTEGSSLAWSLWNGQQWSPRQMLPGATGVQAFSVAANNSGLHVAYVGSPGGVSYLRYSNSAWSGPQTLDASGNSPSLTTDGNNLWCFYANASGDLVYRRTSGAQWNTAVAVTSDGNYNTAPSTLALSPDAKIPVIWTSGPSTSQVVKSAVVAGDSSLAAVSNVSDQVKVTQGGFAVNRTSKLWIAALTVANTGSTTIRGPIQVVLTNLSPNATLANPSGIRSGSPYVTISALSLAPGASVTAQVQFTNSNSGYITYTPVTYSGEF